MAEKLLRNKGQVHQTVASAGSREDTVVAGGPLISRSVQGTFTISSLPIDRDRCQ